MALEGLPEFLEPVIGLTESGLDFISIGINIILSTLVGGLIILVVLAILGKKWGEQIKPVNAFIMIFVINIINLFGIMSLLASVLAVPYILFVLPLLIWVILMKLFFTDLELKHALIAGIVGYVLSIYIFPAAIYFVRGFIPV